MKAKQRAYLELHFAVLLFGLTAILGDLIHLSALLIVWWRVLITCISLFFLIRFGKFLREIPRKIVLQFMGIGVLVALHWLCFFGAVKYSNASICLVCMATTSFFTSFLEPLLLQQRIKWYEILLGLLIIPGMVLVVNNTELSMMAGIAVGLLSAFLAAVFSILNKKMVDQADPMSITFLELGSAWLFLSLLLPFYFYYNPEASFLPNQTDLGYLAILALLCTTLAYVLSLRALKHISAFASNLTINLEPVYGILLAYFILQENEELSNGFYYGVCIILIAVFSYPFLTRLFENKDMVGSNEEIS
ncbi:MAG: DMT family transporter [Saprospiraceae bacterium]